MQVSVPFPGILFLNVSGWSIEQILNTFPSPSRGSYFSICYKKLWCKDFRVSVPFPGILFLNTVFTYNARTEENGFRPLPGDLISQSSPTPSPAPTPGFRPLPGDLISQCVNLIMRNIPIAMIVSVPFPGILFLNHHQHHHRLQLLVSVPFPGILFLNASI